MMELQFDNKLKLEEQWVAHEQQVQKDPTSLRAWLQLIQVVTEHSKRVNVAVAQQESKSLLVESEFAAALSSLIAVNNSVTETFERALRQLPFSYKIWVSYLENCQEQLLAVERLLRRCRVPTETISNYVSNTQRSVLTKLGLAAATLSKMPRIWLNLIDACAQYGAGTRLRSAVKGALTELPPSQMRKVWMHMFHHTLSKAEARENITGVRIPLETYQSLWVRLVNAVPTIDTLEGYLHFLLRTKQTDHILICLDSLTATTAPGDIRAIGRKLLRNNAMIWSEVIELLTIGDIENSFLEADKRQVIFARLLSFLKQHYVGSESGGGSVHGGVVDSMELASAIHMCGEGKINNAIEILKNILSTTNSTHHFQRTFQVLIQILCSACEMAATQNEQYQKQAEDLVADYSLLKIAVALRADPSDPSAWRNKVDLLRERLDLTLGDSGNNAESNSLIALLEDTYEQAILRLTRFNIKTSPSYGILDFKSYPASDDKDVEVQAGEVSVVASEMLQEYSIFLYGRGNEDKATNVLVKGAFYTQFGHIDQNIGLFQRLCDHLVSERKFANLSAILGRLVSEDKNTSTAVGGKESLSIETKPKSWSMYSDVSARSKRVVGGVLGSSASLGAASTKTSSSLTLLHYSPTFWELALKYAFICGDHQQEIHGERIDQKVWEGAKQAGMCSVAVALLYVSQIKQRDLHHHQHRTTTPEPHQSFGQSSTILSLSALLEAKAVLADTFTASRDPRAKCVLATQTLKFFLECKARLNNNSSSDANNGGARDEGEPTLEALIRSGIIKGGEKKDTLPKTDSPCVVLFRESLRELVTKSLRGVIGMRERRKSNAAGNKRERGGGDNNDTEESEENPLNSTEAVMRGQASPDDEISSIFSTVIKELLVQFLEFETAVSTENVASSIAQSRISKPNCPLMTSLGSAWDLASATPKFDALDREGELRTVALVVGNSFHQYPLTLSDLLDVVRRYLILVLEIRGIDALRIAATMLITTANNKHEVALVALQLAKAEEEKGTVENAARVLRQCWPAVCQQSSTTTLNKPLVQSGISVYTKEFSSFYDAFKIRHPGSLSVQK